MIDYVIPGIRQHATGARQALSMLASFLNIYKKEKTIRLQAVNNLKNRTVLMYVCMCIYNNKVFSSFDLKDDVQMENRAH